MECKYCGESPCNRHRLVKELQAKVKGLESDFNLLHTKEMAAHSRAVKAEAKIAGLEAREDRVAAKSAECNQQWVDKVTEQARVIEDATEEVKKYQGMLTNRTKAYNYLRSVKLILQGKKQISKEVTT